MGRPESKYWALPPVIHTDRVWRVEQCVCGVRRVQNKPGLSDFGGFGRITINHDYSLL